MKEGWLAGALAAGCLLGCAGPGIAPAPASSHAAREHVDRLRVDDTYRASSLGSANFGSFHALPRGAYVPAGWDGYLVCCAAWPGCDHHGREIPRCAHCHAAPCRCH